MANTTRDQAQVYYDGMDALEAAIGEADASRFLQIVRKGASGDYTLDRRIRIDAGEYDNLARQVHSEAEEPSRHSQEPARAPAGVTS